MLHAVEAGVRFTTGELSNYSNPQQWNGFNVYSVHVIFGDVAMGGWCIFTGLGVHTESSVRTSITIHVLSIMQVSQKVQESLTERAASFGLILDDISLVRTYFYVVQELNCDFTPSSQV